jgi:superfamily I DNA/RNA helicase
VGATAPEISAVPTDVSAATPLFAGFSDADLVSVSVPPAMLEVVRNVRSVTELSGLAAVLPADAYEALFFLGEGETLDEVRRAMEIEVPVKVAPTDFAASLATDSSKRSFVLVETDEAVAAMLDAPLERWRIFLHPSQRKLVERRWSGPVRVLGGAGTGKTVVAMHRAAWLVQHTFPETDDRVLFTTFTRNLAADIQENLRKLCPPAAFRRIEVEHLDKWVTDFLHQQGYRYQIDYWDGRTGRLRRLWDLALALAPTQFPATFFREEWDYVVQPLGCVTEEDYVRAPRGGRGVRLARSQRKAIWRVFAEYRNLMEEEGVKEAGDALRDATGILSRREAIPRYRSVLVDEGQDMSTAAFKLIRAMVPSAENDIFIVGDAHQRIYRRRSTLSAAGVHVTGRARRLRVNYRTTDEIRRFAVAILEGLSVDDLDAGLDTTHGYKSLLHGEPPLQIGCPNVESEVAEIARWVRNGDLTRTCLVARTAQLLDRYEAGLAGQGIDVYRLRRSEAEDRNKPGLRMATMHRVKGLEFERVVVAGANDGVVPLSEAFAGTEDEAVKEDVERQERSLLYVAVTRAKREVLVTWSGRGSAWIAAVSRNGDG